MKRLATLLIMAPAALSAHGLHAPVAEADVAAHTGAHLAPAVVVIVLAAAVAWARRMRP